MIAQLQQFQINATKFALKQFGGPGSGPRKGGGSSKEDSPVAKTQSSKVESRIIKSADKDFFQHLNKSDALYEMHKDSEHGRETPLNEKEIQSQVDVGTAALKSHYMKDKGLDHDAADRVASHHRAAVEKFVRESDARRVDFVKSTKTPEFKAKQEAVRQELLANADKYAASGDHAIADRFRLLAGIPMT